MSDLKDRLNTLSASERDDVLMYLLSLKNESRAELSDEWINEVKERSTSYRNGKIGGVSYEEGMSRLREK